MPRVACGRWPQSDTNCTQPEAGPNLTLAIVGFIAIANSYLVDWIWMKGAQVSAHSALAGAILLGLPLLLNSFQSLRRGEVGINDAEGTMACFFSAKKSRKDCRMSREVMERGR